MTHEMTNSFGEMKKKKDLALKASTHKNDGSDDEDEEVALLFQKFKRFFIWKRQSMTKAPKHETIKL